MRFKGGFVLLLLLLAFMGSRAVAAGKYIHGIYFFTTSGGSERTDFSAGETVCLEASSSEIVGVYVRVYLIYPSGRYSEILPPKPFKIGSRTTIVCHRFSSNDPGGTYSFKVRLYDQMQNLLEEDSVYFNMGVLSTIPPTPSPQPIPEIILAIAIVGAAAVVGVLLMGRPRPTPLPAGPGPTPAPGITPMGPAGEGTITIKKPGTVMMRGPSGETVTYMAGLYLGGTLIPLTSIPQTFGREDFMGKIPDDQLRLISRRVKGGHFTIGYDYSRGTFTVEDRGSTNGTLLNGVEIRGRGPQDLKDGDVISPAGVVNLVFSLRGAQA